MLDLASIPADVLRARGGYLTVKDAHEASKETLKDFCESGVTLLAQILNKGQSHHANCFDEARAKVDELEAYAKNIRAQLSVIESLAKQRSELKSKAWGK